MRNIARLFAIASSLAAFALVSTPAMSAAKPKAKAKTPASTTNHATLGTTQLNGENAQLGVTYTLGKINPVNITLDKVEYTLEPVIFGNTILWPNKDQKVMVLYYTLHNPNRRDFGLSWSTLKIDAVDSKDTNWRYSGCVAMADTHERCNMSLKPAQKTKVYTCILVPAAGEIPKVMFQSPDKLVLRYDLRGKVKRLPALLADSSDESGATILEKVPAKIGEFYPMKGLHAKIDSVAFSTSPIGGKAPKKGARYLVVLGTAKNNMPQASKFVWSTFKPKVTDADGGEIRWNGYAYYASRDDSIVADMERNQEIRFRYVFETPAGVQPKSLALTQADSHTYVYDLSQVQ